MKKFFVRFTDDISAEQYVNWQGFSVISLLLNGDSILLRKAETVAKCAEVIQDEIVHDVLSGLASYCIDAFVLQEGKHGTYVDNKGNTEFLRGGCFPPTSKVDASSFKLLLSH